jgi:hypothetical protein
VSVVALAPGVIVGHVPMTVGNIVGLAPLPLLLPLAPLELLPPEDVLPPEPLLLPPALLLPLLDPLLPELLLPPLELLVELEPLPPDPEELVLPLPDPVLL